MSLVNYIITTTTIIIDIAKMGIKLFVTIQNQTSEKSSFSLADVFTIKIFTFQDLH